MAVKFIAETDTLEQFRTTFNELCAQDFGDKALNVVLNVSSVSVSAIVLNAIIIYLLILNS